MASNLSGEDRRDLDELRRRLSWCEAHLLRLLDFSPPEARVLPPEPGPVGVFLDLSPEATVKEVVGVAR